MGKPTLNKTRDQNIYSYTDKKGKKKYAYRYRYTRTDGKKTDAYQQNFATAKDAALALTKIKADLLSGNYIKIDHADLTVRGLCEMYLNHLEHKNDKLKPTSVVSINTMMNRVLPLIGDMRVRDLNKYSYNEKVMKAWKGELASGAIINYHVKFCTVLNFAVENEIIERNRLAGIKIKVDRRNNDEIYTKDEIQQILDFVQKDKPHMYEVILFLASTGARAGEACGLKWTEVDFERKSITINCTRDDYGERPPKSPNSTRDIPMTAQLYAALKKYKAKQKAKLLEIGAPVSSEAFEKRYIFLGHNGMPVKYDAIARLLMKATKKCGFYCKAHKFRHTYASVLIAEAVDIATVARLLGDSVATVQKVYVHAVDSKRAEAILKFEKAMGNL